MEKSKTVIEYSIEELKKSLNDTKNIIVPTYQRGICWKPKQKEKLIDTLINQYPFGCILLYKDKEKYKIIDGLQRSNTVIEYYDKPLDYFTENIIPDEIINKIALCTKDEQARDEIRTKAAKIIVDYVKENCKEIEELKNIDISKITIIIANEWPQLSNKTRSLNSYISNIIIGFYDNYHRIRENLKIPALVFSAPEEKLPEIFERINSEGSQLNRYQIYAATWSDDKVVIDNRRLNKIRTLVTERYTKYLGNNGSLDNFDPTELERKKKMNIFDLVYGFGKMISDEYRNLFTYEPEDINGLPKVESIGFNLINACLLQKSSNMRNLNLSLKKYVSYDTKRISNFLINILDCIKYVNNLLNKGIGFKGNKNPEAKITPLHTELQMVSIIASLFVLKYVTYEKDEEDNIKNIIINDTCNSKWAQEYKSGFDNNVLKKYAQDLIDFKWKGSGDSRLYNAITSSEYYTKTIEWDDFKSCLDNYYIRQKNEKNERVKVANPSNADKLILNLIYMEILPISCQLDNTKFDIEHLATKNIMKIMVKEIGNEKYSLPISSIGNLCLLPKEYNELKGERLIYQFKEYFDKNTKQTVEVPIKKIEKKYSFTKEKDFEWLMNNNNKYTEETFTKAYMTFIDNRYRSMENKIKKNLFFEENDQF